MSLPAELPAPTFTEAGAPYRPAPALPSTAVKRRVRLAAFRRRELLAVALVAVGCDTWWWRSRLGGYGGAFLGLSLLLALRIGGPARKPWTRTVPFELLVGLTCLRLAYDPGPLSFTLLFGSVLALAAARRGGSITVTAVARSALAGFPALGTRIPALVRGLGSASVVSRLARPRSFAPVLVPAALATVFAGIFAIANPLVARGLDIAFTFLRDRLLLPNPARIALLLTAALGASVIVRPVLRRPTSLTEPAAPTTAASDTGLATARNSLVLLNLVFLAYNGVDAFSSARIFVSGSLPAGVTTQRYAHEGAFWLTVALALVTVVLGYFFRGSLATEERARFPRRLTAAWVAQSGVLALGTALRLAVHVLTSGVSDLRFVGALGTTLVAVGLGLVGWKIRKNLRFRWLLERQLAAFAFALALYALVPTHRIGATYNVPRILAGDDGPLVHLRAEASEVESAPLLLPLLHHPDPRIRAGVAALLRTKQQALSSSDEHPAQQSYAKVEATRALAAARPEIDDALVGVCPRRAETTLAELVELTVDGQAPPSLLRLPAAEAQPCYEARGYD